MMKLADNSEKKKADHMSAEQHDGKHQWARCKHGLENHKASGFEKNMSPGLSTLLTDNCSFSPQMQKSACLQTAQS